MTVRSHRTGLVAETFRTGRRFAVRAEGTRGKEGRGRARNLRSGEGNYGSKVPGLSSLRKLSPNPCVVDFQAEEATYARMVQMLGTIFQGRPGLTSGDGTDAAEAGFEPDRRPPAR